MGARLGQGQLELMASSKDFLGGLKLVKAHAVEGQHVADLQRRTGALRDELLGFASHQSSTRGWFEIGSAVLLAALLYGAATWAHTALAEMLLLVLVFSRLLPVLRDSQLQLQQLAHMMPAFVSVQDWIGRCHAAREGVSAGAGGEASKADPPAASHRMLLRQALRFDNVTLRYQDSETDAVTGLNLVLQAGTTTALMGASGSGKTTVADMALGLMAPTAGAVFVDGKDLAMGASQRQWRASVAYVAQDTYLFPASIRDNLCWLAGPKSDDEIWQALEQAAARDFVATLAAGLDHRIGERGEGLSGGQRQRLALARALLCRPQLLVLDEVTSQLDPDSEARVLVALAQLRGHMTVLTIAHRAAAIAQADRVITLEAGRVIGDTAG
jgi:ATP-binding cassette subfamily C protein